MECSTRARFYEMALGYEQQQHVEYQAHLETTRTAILDANKTVEQLSIDTWTLQVRVKELELDEEIVKKSEEEAVVEKIMAQKQLIEMGGSESAIRSLKRSLEEAKRELAQTQAEKTQILEDERKFEKELQNLGVVLQRCRSNCVRLQDEYARARRAKQEMVSKLKQLSHFLQEGAAPTNQRCQLTAATAAPVTSSSPTAPVMGVKPKDHLSGEMATHWSSKGDSLEPEDTSPSPVNQYRISPFPSKVTNTSVLK